MNKKWIAAFLGVSTLLTIGLITITADSTNSGDGSQIFSEDIVWQGNDFAEGEIVDLVIDEDGVTLLDGAAFGQYISPIISSQISFNVLVPQWIAQASDESGWQPGGTIQLFVRTAAVDGSWEPWQQVYFNADWTLPDDVDDVGQMIVVPNLAVHDLVQFSANLNRGFDGVAPRLNEFRLTALDSTQGPSAAEMERELPSAPESANGNYPKPPVVPRTEWCTNPDCNYSNGLAYEPVTHLLVHHTVTANSAVNWPAIVRAIWSFHTYTRGWGDIGYNYLIDPTGVIYEGHIGGDDVVGTHASGANAGSMGVSLMGTFTRPDENPPGIVPPAAMQDSLVEILAWKADQKNIDIYSSGGMPGLNWGINHLSGHRDVYGTTTCPGEQAHDLIPSLRARIAAAINWVPTHTYLDDQSAAFTKSNANWHDGPYQCGFDTHAYFTYSVTDPGQSTNWGEWRPTIEDAGWYEVEVFAPYCNTGEPDTTQANYRVNHANGTDTVIINQRDNLGEWVSLGSFEFDVGTNGTVYLSDLTQSDSGSGVWFDAIRLNYIAPTINNMAPQAAVWELDRIVDFSWNITNPSAVAAIELQVATDNSFNDIVYSQSWSGSPSSHQHTFGADHSELFWRVNMTLTSSTVISSAATSFGIDSQAPSSMVDNIVQIESGDYFINWSGNDATSGIAGYNVEYRVEGSGSWLPLLTGTTATNYRFEPPDPGTQYWFRSQAYDNAGLTEPIHGGDGDISTAQSVLLSPAIMFPIVMEN